MIPNLISASRLVLVIPLAFMLWASQGSNVWRWLVIVLFFLMAFSDWLDGMLARRFSAQTALGKVLDPAGDKTVAAVCFVVLAGLGLRIGGYPIPLWLMTLVVGKDLWMVVGYLVIRMMGVDIAVRPSVWGKLSTFFQLALVGSILVGPELAWMGLGFLRDVLLWVAAGMTVVATVAYTRTAILRLATVRLEEAAGYQRRNGRE